MRITFVLASGFGLAGGERTIAQWAAHLQRRGHEVLLISPPPRRPTLRDHARAWRQGKHLAPVSRASHFDNVPVRRVLLEKYRPVSDRDVPDADVVIATWWETAEWVAALAPRKGAHVYLIQHHEIFDYLPKARVAATYRLPLHKIVIAAWLEQVMRETYGDTDVSLIYQGIDRTLFDAPPRGKQATPTVGLMYSPLYWKGCDVSLRAFALAKEQIPELQLVAFGSEYPTAALPLPREATFVHQPPQKSLRELYASCDAWLFGSRTEGFALPPLEAMACRTPVIGTMAGGEAEVIAKGGIPVPQEDADAMARAICGVVKASDTEWRTLSDRAYATVAPYTWERSTDQLEAALQLALERNARGELRPA
jgi:glycosyltransferase involved in cell wall biosynthesis